MKIKDISLCGLFAGVLAICAWISFPVFGLPVTLQTFGLHFALLLLGGKRGCIAIFVYLALGILGLPVFSGFGGGIGTLLGPTGGYLWGFLAGGLLYWGISAHWGGRAKLTAAVLAQICCYLCGMFWFSYQFANENSLWSVFLTTIAPFLLPDALKLGLAYLLSRRLGRHIS